MVSVFMCISLMFYHRLCQCVHVFSRSQMPYKRTNIQQNSKYGSFMRKCDDFSCNIQRRHVTLGVEIHVTEPKYVLYRDVQHFFPSNLYLLTANSSKLLRILPGCFRIRHFHVHKLSQPSQISLIDGILITSGNFSEFHISECYIVSKSDDFHWMIFER